MGRPPSGSAPTTAAATELSAEGLGDPPAADVWAQPAMPACGGPPAADVWAPPQGGLPDDRAPPATPAYGGPPAVDACAPSQKDSTWAPPASAEEEEEEEEEKEPKSSISEELEAMMSGLDLLRDTLSGRPPAQEAEAAAAPTATLADRVWREVPSGPRGGGGDLQAEAVFPEDVPPAAAGEQAAAGQPGALANQQPQTAALGGEADRLTLGPGCPRPSPLPAADNHPAWQPRAAELGCEAGAGLAPAPPAHQWQQRQQEPALASAGAARPRPTAAECGAFGGAGAVTDMGNSYARAIFSHEGRAGHGPPPPGRPHPGAPGAALRGPPGAPPGPPGAFHGDPAAPPLTAADLMRGAGVSGPAAVGPMAPPPLTAADLMRTAGAGDPRDADSMGPPPLTAADLMRADGAGSLGVADHVPPREAGTSCPGTADHAASPPMSAADLLREASAGWPDDDDLPPLTAADIMQDVGCGGPGAPEHMVPPPLTAADAMREAGASGLGAADMASGGYGGPSPPVDGQAAQRLPLWGAMPRPQPELATADSAAGRPQLTAKDLGIVAYGAGPAGGGPPETTDLKPLAASFWESRLRGAKGAISTSWKTFADTMDGIFVPDAGGPHCLCVWP
ncbi:unnamed protein product [Prorocentrum cordatum]|uniref:Uncharacterized protein n=1 Tax=Prorocentrum cordatum TaxID=2364126 RepID=A0ABN9UJJ0_9DINO|nr:unnamed protein product [Polarella glacialis]